ncbi:PASTA domain-containing protein [uncultured Modestobacter sp.]|uniref:PASTA domain-containing protein n=1 Tax=uncultured Modestobacter sp. TaxID=380048 RepID=UPI00260A68EC|nr:PASTA domain-containing protein [uncultured Modestobacter sp.]
MPSISGRLIVCAALAPLALLTGCGAEEVQLPDLVGLPLDEAHRALEELGFQEFEDQDAFEDRVIVRDANWVVLEVTPGAGEPVAVDQVIAFSVGKLDEQRAIDELPAESPVAQQFAAEQAAERDRLAAEEAEALQEQSELLTGYVNDLDPLVRLGNRVFAEVGAMAAGVQAEEYGLGQVDVVLAAAGSTDTLVDELRSTEPPAGSRRAGTHEELVASAERLTDAARTLLSAEAGERASSLERYGQVVAEARSSWNSALTAMYAGTGIAAPLLP